MRPFLTDRSEDERSPDAGAHGLDPARPLAHLHGIWRDRVRGSTICIDARRRPLRVAYCSGGDHELSGVFEGWSFDGRQFIARFRWLHQPIAGYIVLQTGHNEDYLVGGWWYAHDVPRPHLLPFVPGVNHCLWSRLSDAQPWPRWATDHLELPPGCTTESLLGAGERAQRRALTTAATSELRYHRRLELWTGGAGGVARLAARLRHQGWWLVHNLLVHPLLALAPRGPCVALHDWTSRRLSRDDLLADSPAPRIERRGWWLLHNLVTHPAIGLFPCRATFAWHDRSAARMRVPGWA